MDQIIIEGIRCFSERQEVPLRPLTVLVGENSTGKSTFLALVRMAWDLCHGTRAINFNEEPFLLGTYDQIASYRGGRTRQTACLRIGARVALGTQGRTSRGSDLPAHATVEGCFTSEGQSRASDWMLSADPYLLRFEYRGGRPEPLISIATSAGPVRIDPESFPPYEVRISDLLRHLWYKLREDRSTGTHARTGQLFSGSDLDILEILTDVFEDPDDHRPYAFAPIRTRPQRTYEPLDTAAGPEGQHVPIILARTSAVDPAGWQRLRQAIDQFGSASGLFRSVGVRRLGDKDSDPFQLTVKVAGRAFNLVDVGYGVSQALPMIVDCVREPEGSTFLLQQPEVHLHPRAQAELGSFLAVLAKEQRKRFVIETHSDYLVDRIRMDVRDHKFLKPEDVAILYFERNNGEVNIKALEIDDHGNLVNVPAGYRQFFLEEEKRFIGY